jgi:hypothetical protein
VCLSVDALPLGKLLGRLDLVLDDVDPVDVGLRHVRHVRCDATSPTSNVEDLCDEDGGVSQLFMRYILIGKCLLGKCYFGQMSFRANV